MSAASLVDRVNPKTKLGSALCLSFGRSTWPFSLIHAHTSSCTNKISLSNMNPNDLNHFPLLSHYISCMQIFLSLSLLLSPFISRIVSFSFITSDAMLEPNQTTSNHSRLKKFVSVITKLKLLRKLLNYEMSV